MADYSFAQTLKDIAGQRQRSRLRTEQNNQILSEMLMSLPSGTDAQQVSSPGNAPVELGNTSLRGMEGSNAFQRFVRSIAQQESGGNYNARNSSSGAMGKYQIMPSNILGSGGWDKEALGYNISPNTFMSNKNLQEQIALFKLREYFNKYGPSGAAQAWYGGPGSVGHNVSGGAGYPDSNAYARQVRRRMKRGR